MSNNSNDKPALSYGEMVRKIELADTDDKPAALTIRSVSRRNMAPKTSRNEEIKLVIVFAEEFTGNKPEEKRREYVVNATSYKTLCDRYGTDETRWAGKVVVMAPTQTEYGGATFEKLHVASPDRWEKVLNATAAAAKRRK
jgi:hypothetical protein